MQLLFYGPKYFCKHNWKSFENSLNHKSQITHICGMTFCFKVLLETFKSVFEKWCVMEQWELKLINTAKISHHFGHENKSQKNTALLYWMKLLVVWVEKSEVCKSFLHCYSSRRLIWFASASTFYVQMHPLPASIPGKLGSKLPKVSQGQRPCKNQNTIDWTGLHHWSKKRR